MYEPSQRHEYKETKHTNGGERQGMRDTEVEVGLD